MRRSSKYHYLIIKIGRSLKSFTAFFAGTEGVGKQHWIIVNHLRSVFDQIPCISFIEEKSVRYAIIGGGALSLAINEKLILRKSDQVYCFSR